MPTSNPKPKSKSKTTKRIYEVSDWFVFQARIDGIRANSHILGKTSIDEYHISDKVAKFHHKRRTAITVSGDKYILLHPGREIDPGTQLTLNIWQAASNIPGINNITGIWYELMKA